MGSSGFDLPEAQQKIEDLDEALTALATRDPRAAADAFDALTDAAGLTGSEVERLEGLLDGYSGALASVDTQNELTAGSTGEGADAMGEMAASTEDARAAIDQYTDAMTGLFDPLFAAETALRNQQQAVADLHAKQLELVEAVRVHGEGSIEAAAAQEALTEAETQARTAIVDLNTAATELTFAINEQGLSVESARQKFIEMAVQQGLTAEEAALLAGQLFLTEQAALAFAGDYTANLLANNPASGVIDRVQRELNALDGRTVTTTVIAQIFERVTRTTTVRPGEFLQFHEGGVVPGPRGQEVAAVLQAGETVVGLDDPVNKFLSGHLSGPMLSAESMAGSTTVFAPEFHFHGPVASERQAMTWVSKAWNKSVRTGSGVNFRG